MSEKVQAKADQYLTGGRVRLLEVSDEACLAEVSGSAQEPYGVRYSNGLWHCECPARVNECAHVLAVQKVCPFQDRPGQVSLASAVDEDLLSWLNS